VKNSRRIFISAIALAFASVAPFASASEFGTSAEATAMVKKATAFLKANGKEKTLAEVSKGNGQFVDRDLYISVYDMNGNVLAHGTNPKLIGKDVSALKDANGKEFIKDILGQAKANGKGQADYVWPNPVSKELQPKSVYFEKADDMVFSSGYYKK
jgi:cytochrome c